jgi:diaminohydroxyphosphoribosylaminopyrimidine deaminase/5-amino-6-(5-phosphoribosylamino)uracil reductase
MRDEELMARAVALGAAARRRTPPNPWVGCVLVRDGVIVGEGASEPPGRAHAEAGALREAGERARGATAYVTLEPCSHHGRTPPCADALVDAGVSRVVVAINDPDQKVQGRGIARLRDADIDVVDGVGADQAERSLAPYLHHRRTGGAWCLVKTAMSLDGCTAAADGTSKWITGEAARADAHGLRADSQAIVVGSGTALADRPALTVRGVESPPPTPPLRVLLDSRGRVPAEGPLFDVELAPTLVVTTEHAPASVTDAWHAAGAKVETIPPDFDGRGVALQSLLWLLGHHGVLQAMFEGGATLHGALLNSLLVDRVTAYVAPTILGAGGRAAFGSCWPDSLAHARRYRFIEQRRVGDDLRIDFERAMKAG